MALNTQRLKAEGAARTVGVGSGAHACAAQVTIVAARAAGVGSRARLEAESDDAVETVTARAAREGGASI